MNKKWIHPHIIGLAQTMYNCKKTPDEVLNVCQTLRLVFVKKGIHEKI